MVRAWPVVVWVVVGCGGGGDDLVAELDGPWTGSLSDPETGDVPLAADFEWREDEALLFGTVTATIAGETDPWVFAVRRWDTGAADLVLLDLTDEADATRGMNLDGTVDDGTFSGSGDLTYDCAEGVCGFEGDFTLDRG